MWIDTHAHLFDLSRDQLCVIINEAIEASIGLIVSTATNLENSLKVIQHCSISPLFLGAIGVSPFDIESQKPDWHLQLRSLLPNPRIIAIGEIGLDATNTRYPDIKKQIQFFETQLKIAKEFNLPAIIHSRGAEETTLDICKHIGNYKIVYHCFTGDYAIAKKIIDQGYFISFSGIITFKNASIRSIISKLPVENVLIETDSPYLAPVPFRGKPNKPSLLAYTGAEIARLLAITPENLQKKLEKNFYKCFNIDK